MVTGARGAAGWDPCRQRPQPRRGKCDPRARRLLGAFPQHPVQHPRGRTAPGPRRAGALGSGRGSRRARQRESCGAPTPTPTRSPLTPRGSAGLWGAAPGCEFPRAGAGGSRGQPPPPRRPERSSRPPRLDRPPHWPASPGRPPHWSAGKSPPTKPGMASSLARRPGAGLSTGSRAGRE